MASEYGVKASAYSWTQERFLDYVPILEVGREPRIRTRGILTLESIRGWMCGAERWLVTFRRFALGQANVARFGGFR